MRAPRSHRLSVRGGIRVASGEDVSRLRTLVLASLVAAACSNDDVEPVRVAPEQPRPEVPVPTDGGSGAPTTPIALEDDGGIADGGRPDANEAGEAEEPCPPVGT